MRSARPRLVRIVRRGDRLPSGGELVLEDGSELGAVRAVPRDVPYGYHRLRRGAEEQLLLVAPPRCPLPRGWRTWGWAVQLYAARSRASWGMGDLADLRRLAAWSAELGAGALLVSPLGASNPAPDPEPSPYYPSSRRFRDPLYLAIEEVPGYRFLASELAPLARAGRALNGSSAIVRSEVRRLKLAALERLWRASPAGGSAQPQLDEPTAAARPDLRRWGLFAALSEEHGPGWGAWPDELRDPESIAVRREARRLTERIAFHAWVQRLLDRQMAAAGGELRLINDLPIGFDPGGFDAWVWQPMLGAASLGAPPDVFNPAGQRWGLPPFVPARLRAGRLPAVHRHDPGGHGARRRPADRPRAGAVPPVVGAGRRGPGRRRVREPTHRRAAGGAGHRGRAGRGRGHRRGPGHRGAGRPAAAGIGQRAVHAPRLVRAAAARGLAAQGAWPASPPTTCRPWPAPGPAPTLPTRRGRACRPIGAASPCCDGASPGWPACRRMRRWPA